MSKPVTIPNTFATQSGNVPASQLDADYSVLAAAINDTGTYGNYLADTGAVNALVVTTPANITFSYATGVWLEVLVANTNTLSTVNLNVNGLGNQLVRSPSGGTLPIGALVAGTVYRMVFDGSVFRAALPSFVANVATFPGADPSGVGDSTSAIQTAVNTGLSVYFPASLGTSTKYSVSSAVALSTPQQRLYGEGVNSLIFATSGFNLAQKGVFAWTQGAYPNGALTNGPHFDNLHISCDQSAVATPPGAAIASASQTVASPGVFTTAAQTWVAGQPVYITGTAPGGFSINVVYYVIAAGLTATTAQLSSTIGGTGLACTSSSACNLQPCFARASLVQYPAALYLRNAPRFKVTNCLIEQFLIGIDAQGYSAGFVLDIVYLCAYTLGVVIDGNGDTIHMDYLHCIPYDTWTTNQKAIYYDGGKTDIVTGRNDGTDMTNCLFLGPCVSINSFTGTGVHYPGTFAGSGWLTGKTGNAQIVNTGFDTAAQIISAGVGSTLTLTNCYFSNGAAGNASQVVITAGTILINGGFTQSTPVPSVPFFTLNNASGQLAQLNLGGGFTFNAPQGTGTLVSMTGSTLSLVSITNCNFLVADAANGPLVTSVGANVRLTFSGNQFSASTRTGNIALSIDTDNTHVVQGNSFNGWNIAVPPGTPIASASQTVANPGVFTTAAQTWSAGQQLYITGTAPGGFALNTIYYVIAGGLTATTAELALTPGGAGIQCTASAACSLVPVNVSTFTQASIGGNTNRGTLNFNNANVQPLTGVNGSSTVAAGATVNLGPGGYQAGAANVNAWQLPKAGYITGFQVKATTGPGIGQTYTYTVLKNGVATTMVGSTTGAQGNTTSVGPPIAVVANDNVELQIVVSGGANAGNHKFSIIYEPA